MRLPRNLSDCVVFALWCEREGQQPAAVARLLVLAKKHKTAWERSNDSAATMAKYDQQAERWANRFEQAAGEMGYGTQWPGLWPVLLKNGQNVYLPDVHV